MTKRKRYLVKERITGESIIALALNPRQAAITLIKQSGTDNPGDDCWHYDLTVSEV